MPALNFREIADASGGRERDQFELLARDFLQDEGFEIIVGPDRGPDAGRDLLVRELRHGPGGTSSHTWLVSCKHKARSGSAVGCSDEQNLRDRIETHHCHGLIAFYSTVPSSALSTHLYALRPKYDVLIYDQEKIEGRLLSTPKGRTIAARYFPASYAKWVVSSQYAGATEPKPVPIHDRFFLREPHCNLGTARAEAEARNLPLFVVIYDELHSSHSRLNHCLGYFMEWETTKRLVDEHFVVVMGPSSDAELGKLVPSDDPLEECRWVVLNGTDLVRSESVYANSTEGRKRIREVLRLLAERS